MAQDDRILTQDEACDAYPDEWVVMQATDYEPNGMARAGIVLAHGPTRRSIQPEIMRQIHAGQGDQPYLWVFCTQARIRSFEEWGACLDEVLRKAIAGERTRR